MSTILFFTIVLIGGISATTAMDTILGYDDDVKHNNKAPHE